MHRMHMTVFHVSNPFRKTGALEKGTPEYQAGEGLQGCTVFLQRSSARSSLEW